MTFSIQLKKKRHLSLKMRQVVSVFFFLSKLILICISKQNFHLVKHICEIALSKHIFNRKFQKIILKNYFRTKSCLLGMKKYGEKNY